MVATLRSAPLTQWLVVAVLACGFWLGALPGVVHATGPLTYTVTTTNDDVIGSNCQSANNGGCTLRQAINAANANDPGSGTSNTVVFASGVRSTIVLHSVLVVSGHNLTIQGPGAGLLAIDGGCSTGCGTNSASRGSTVLLIGNRNLTLALSGLTIQNGNAPAGNPGGGGIYLGTTNTLQATNMTFTHNSAPFRSAGSGDGGVIYAESNAAITLMNCTVSNNYAGFSGGGIYTNTGTTLAVTNTTISGNSTTNDAGGGIENHGALMVTNSTISGNSTQSGLGGGIENDQGTATVADSTISGNQAVDGGGIDSNGTLTLTNTTISLNSATNLGGGIETVGGMTLTSSIVSGNTAPAGPNVNGGYTSGDPNNIIDMNAKLAPLNDYGGPTQTFALLYGSPALDIGPCPMGITIDQRGVARPQGGKCDAGSFESRGFTLTGNGNQSTLPGQAFPQTLAITLTSNDPGVPMIAVSGTVTFTLVSGGGGASAAFATSGGSMCTVSGDHLTATCAMSNGQASSPTVTARSTPGTVTATATLPGASSASFLLSFDPLSMSGPTTFMAGLGGTNRFQLGALGGTGGYTYGVTGGSLPAGMTLSPGGVLSGVPTSAGTTNFTVTVTDSANETASGQYAVTVVMPQSQPKPPPVGMPAGGTNPQPMVHPGAGGSGGGILSQPMQH